MIEKTIHIGPAYDGGMGSVIQGYKKLFGLPKENIWNTYKSGFIRSLPCVVAICFKILIKEQNNIICYHLHSASQGSMLRKLIIAFCLKLKKKKFIIHLHGSRYQGHYLQRTMVKILVKISNAVVCITEQQKNLIEKENPQYKVFVIPNFCETIIENPIELEKHKNPVKIVFSGRYEQRKGIYILLTAFEKANFHVPVQLDLYGGGEVEKVRKIVENSPQKQYINVNDWTQHDEYLRKLSKYDFLVLPSYSETFGLALIEAMGLGIPVLSTFGGAIPKVVKNNETGLLVEFGNIDQLTVAFEELANNIELRIKLGKNAWLDVKNRFSPRIVLEKLEEMYNKI